MVNDQLSSIDVRPTEAADIKQATYSFVAHEIAQKEKERPYAQQDQAVSLSQEAELCEKPEASDADVGVRCLATSSFAAVSLTACGGEESQSASPPVAASNETPIPTIALSEASRFLAQASVGTTYGAIEQLANDSFEGWLATQFATRRSRSNWDWLMAKGYGDASQIGNLGAWQNPLWKGLFTGNDVLRQRTTLALLDLFVVGINGVQARWRIFCLANYLDILADNSFGNFRTLLEEITYSTAMGSWLTYIGSGKADGRGRLPDENYAREIMQLFTIGLFELEQDGSLKLDSGGRAIATYAQSDVSELAKVFTGMDYSSAERDQPERHRERLVFDAAQNDQGSAHFLGETVSGGGPTALAGALDILFHHSNVAPFISRRLIQSLVTSNPTRGYIRRVASVFADNGNGERGDMKAVWRAILLDREARSSGGSFAGRLRDPIQRLLNWGRAFSVRDPEDHWSIPPSLTNPLIKSPGWSPTVFNFYEPDYSPPYTQIDADGLFAPEFQLVNEQSNIAYVNFMQKAIDGFYDYRGLNPDFSAYLDDAKDPVRLVEKLDLILAAGQLTPAAKQAIQASITTMPSATQDDLERRIKLATLGVMVSPGYLILE